MLDAVPLASTIYVLLLTLGFVAACWAYTLFLTSDRLHRRFSRWPFRWLSLLDLLVAAAFCAFVFALSFLLFHVSGDPPLH